VGIVASGDRMDGTGDRNDGSANHNVFAVAAAITF